jgi:hypothetical protein
MFVLERDFYLCTYDCTHENIYQSVDWLIYYYVFWLAHKSTELAEFMDKIDYRNILSCPIEIILCLEVVGSISVKI